MFNFKCLSKKREDGFSLIEVLVTIAILSIGAVALTRWQVTGMKANKSASLRQDIMDVKRTITNSLSCGKTFESFGATRPIACNVAVTLKDKNGNSLTNDGKIGAWTIEASCENIGSPAVNGLSIYATQPGKIDPLRNITLDRNHPVAMLFSPEVRLCKDFFEVSPTPAGQCSGPGEYVKSVDFNTKTAVCGTIQTCNSGERLTFNGSNLVCKPIHDNCVTVTNMGPAPFYHSVATCPVGTKIVNGGGQCESPGSGLCADLNLGVIHNTGVYGNGWETDCYRSDGLGDACSLAWAYCCPL